MVHGLANHSFGATASVVLFVTGVAGVLIIYATLTFVDLLEAGPALDLLRLVR